MSKWISVKDRLPKNGQTYLVFLPDETPCNKQETAEYVNGSWFTRSGGCYPTHWQPLPKAPRGK